MENDIDSSHTLAIRDMTAALEKQFDPRLTVPLDQSGKIQVELVCRRCLYNLRGLTLDGNCPECNTPVNFSIQKDHLQFSNPAWVNKLRSGSATIFNTTITCIVAIIIIGFPIHALTPSNITVPNVMISGGFLLLFLFASVFQIGVWNLTSPNPSAVDAILFRSIRVLLRASVIGAFACTLMVLYLCFSRLVQGRSVNELTLKSLFVAVCICWAGTIILLMGYLGKLAMKTPDDHLSKTCFRLFWICLALAIGMIGSLFYPIQNTRANQSLSVEYVILAVTFVTFVKYIIVLGAFKQELHQQSVFANHNSAQRCEHSQSVPR